MKKIRLFFNTLLMLGSWVFLEIASLIIKLFRIKPRKENTALLLAFALPPVSNSGTHRPLSFIQAAQNCSWQLSSISDPVTSSPSQAGLFLKSQLPENTKITRFSPLFRTTSWQLTPKVDGGFTNAISLVFHAIKQHWRTRPAVIIASAPPFYLAIAGMYLAKLFGSKLVLDYRDEWTLCPFEFVSKTAWDSWFEKRCIKAADKIIYTTHPHKNSHQTAFNIPSEKQSVIANGWDEKLAPASSNTPNSILNPEKLNISYIGKLSKHSDPSSFLTAIKTVFKRKPELLGKLAINFVGSKHPEMLEVLEVYGKAFPVINIIDEVTKTDALAIMNESDYLLMLCEKRLAGYIPGKLYDYLSTHTQIISYGHQGEVSRIIGELTAGTFIGEGDYEALEKLLSKDPAKTLEEYVADWLSQHERKKLAHDFFKILSSL